MEEIIGSVLVQVIAENRIQGVAEDVGESKRTMDIYKGFFTVRKNPKTGNTQLFL